MKDYIVLGYFERILEVQLNVHLAFPELNDLPPSECIIF